MNKKIKEISDDLQANEEYLKEKTKTLGCFIIKETEEWINDAKKRPIPNMLFNEFWYENELCILFADTNLGKSILAVQIADSISKGKPIPGFKLETKAKKVLYIDFELSDKQLENRYSNNYKNHYKFNENFKRAELNPNFLLPKDCKSLEEYIIETLEKTVKEKQIKVLIVDNLTYLNSDNEKAKNALELMKLLKKLTKENNVSVLVLSHTPKRDNSKPITKDDLAGSKMLMNFCDSSFAIGASSQGAEYRYLKQIKQRNTEHLYHSGNIIVCTLEKEDNFLLFNFIDYESESMHLSVSLSGKSTEESNEQILELLDQGLSNVKIGAQLGISEGAVRKRRKKLGV